VPAMALALLLGSVSAPSFSGQYLEGSPDDGLTATVSRSEPNLIRVEGRKIRRIQGVLALARKHGAALAGDGCAAALESGVIRDGYRFLRRWLERRPQLTLCQVDPIIRQLTLYRDLIAERTQENL